METSLDSDTIFACRLFQSFINFYFGNVDLQSIWKKWLHYSSKHGRLQVPLSVSHQCKTAPPQKPMKYVLAIAKLYRSPFTLYWLALDCLIIVYWATCIQSCMCESRGGKGRGYEKMALVLNNSLPQPPSGPLWEIFNPVFYRIRYMFIMLF